MATTLPTSLGSPTLPRSSRPIIQADPAAGLDMQIAASRGMPTGIKYVAAGLNDVANADNYIADQQNKLDAKDQLTNFSKDMRTILYGDGTPENPGYYSYQGQDAVNKRQSTVEAIGKLKDKYLQKSTNAQVGNLFSNAADTIADPEYDTLSRYAIKQQGVAQDASSSASIEEATNRFAANPTNETVREQAMFTLGQETLAVADRNGILDPVAREQAVKDAQSNAYTSAIRTALGRDLQAGKDLYNRYKDNIVGTEQSKMDMEVKQAENTARAEQEHQMVMARQAKSDAEDASDQDLVHNLLAGKLTPTMIDKSNSSASSKLTMINALRAKDDGADKLPVDNSLFVKTWQQIDLPSNDPHAITDRLQFSQLLGKGFNTAMIGQLDDEFDKVRKPGGDARKVLKDQLVKAARTAITGQNELLGIKDTKGEAQMGKFLSWMIQQEDKSEKSGASDMDMFSPDGKSSLYQGIDQFKRPLTQQMQDLLNDNPGNEDVAAAASRINADTGNLPVIDGTNPADKAAYDAIPLGKPYMKKMSDGTLKQVVKTQGTPSAASAVAAPSGE